MKIGAVDHIASMISSAQAIRNIQAQMLRHEIKKQMEKNYDRNLELQLSRRRNELMLDQTYFERAVQRARLAKGTNVDLYI